MNQQVYRSIIRATTAKFISKGDGAMMNTRGQTVCFTGHRSLRASDTVWRENLKKTLLGLIDQGYKDFMAGGARGFDMAASEIVLELRELHPHINLILVLPFVNQYTHEKGWAMQEIERYHALEEQAQEVIHLQENYSTGCYYRRNRYMVDSSSVCICYQYKDSGGTAYTTKYARGKEVKIINVCNVTGS